MVTIFRAKGLAEFFVTTAALARSSLRNRGINTSPNQTKTNLMKLTVIAAVTAGALALGTLSAQGPEGHHMMMGNPLEHLTKELNLSADQQAKVAPIVDAAKPQIRAIHEEAMQKMRAILEASGAQIRPLLTPEQQTKYDALKKAHQDMMNAMKEMHEASSH